MKRFSGKTLTCMDVRELLSDFHQDKLNPFTRGRVKQHLLDCLDCSTAYVKIIEADIDAGSIPLQFVPADYMPSQSIYESFYNSVIPVDPSTAIAINFGPLIGAALAAKGEELIVDAEETMKDYAVEKGEFRLTLYQDEDEDWIVSYRTQNKDLANGKLNLVISTIEETKTVIEETLPLVPARGNTWEVRYPLPKHIDLRQRYKIEVSPVPNDE